MNISFAASARKAILISLGCIILLVTSLGCSQKDPSFEPGKKIYEQYCAACHGVEGSGLLYKKTALNNSAFVLGDPQGLIAVILFGRGGAGLMPGWQTTLNDQEVAAVATYTRQAWSNQGDAVTPALVAEVRKKGEQKSVPGSPSQ